MESPVDAHENAAAASWLVVKAMISWKSAWIVLDLALIALCIAMAWQAWCWNKAERALDGADSPEYEQVVSLRTILSDPLVDLAQKVASLQRTSSAERASILSRYFRPYSYISTIETTAFPAFKIKTGIPYRTTRATPTLEPLIIGPPLPYRKTIDVQTSPSFDERGREKLLGEWQPIFSAVLPFFIVFARDLANDDVFPLTLLSQVTLGLLLVTIGALQAYGQKRAKRYRVATEAQIDRIGRGVDSIGRGVDRLGRGISRISADIRSIADEISSEDEAGS